MASKLHEKTKEILRKLYPLADIREEYPIKADGINMFIDLYVDEPFCVAVECQGRQHTEFVSHFHKDYYGFFRSKKLDKLKEEWCLENGVPIAYVYEHEDITCELLQQRIRDAEVAASEYERGRNNE